MCGPQPGTEQRTNVSSSWLRMNRRRLALGGEADCSLVVGALQGEDTVTGGASRELGLRLTRPQTKAAAWEWLPKAF